MLFDASQIDFTQLDTEVCKKILADIVTIEEKGARVPFKNICSHNQRVTAIVLDRGERDKIQEAFHLCAKCEGDFIRMMTAWMADR